MRRMKHSYQTRLFAAAAMVAIPIVAAASTPQVQFQTLALSGTDGPLGPQLGTGVMFSSLSGTNLNTSGQVGFFGALSGAGITTANDQGDWLASSVGITPI